MTTNNLPPIPEGYELVPKEDYDKPKAEGTMFFNKLVTDWTVCRKSELSSHHDGSYYIRPIKPVATSEDKQQGYSCATCKHHKDAEGNLCNKGRKCGLLLKLWEPKQPTESLSCKTCKSCKHYHDNGSPCLPIIECAKAMFSKWEPKESPTTEKPPLGLMPRAIWESSRKSNRIADIRNAMSRYACDKKDIPYSWVEELFDLETELSFGKEQL